ncbi:MAG: AMP-binding protein, partial [Clostridia bacterium]|nr:AMP-binding protein [Clostridia bacterium]
MKDALLKRFSPRLEFDSYEDFKQNFTINVPDDFNFGYDVVDAWAELEPGKKALVWCNDAGEERIFTFNDVKALSNRICNYLVSLGIRKGDKVMLIMKRRWEYWMTAAALHKLGAVMIPASFQLTEKDLIYRINAAGVRMIVTAED